MQSLANARLTLAASATLSLAFLPLAVFNHGAVAAFCKVGSIALLIVIAAKPPALPRLVAALSFSALGDFLLELHSSGPFGEDRLFLLGLLAFLSAHICYIALFAAHYAPVGVTPQRRLGTILIIVALVVMQTLLWPYLGSMRLPVAIYSLALATMGITAQQSSFRGIVAFGAVLFVASDSLLAWQHFRAPFSFAGPLIWFSYYLAQVSITTGVEQEKQA